ncbi:MAG: MBL fold metallo-hydrolase [Bacteroidetes bacterium]|nr:MBL fold metallo-hydrolase [Bacteroidota bacterium]
MVASIEITDNGNIFTCKFPTNTFLKKILNPQLPIIKSDWIGNPLDSKGRYMNIEFPFTSSWMDVYKWQTGPKPLKEIKRADTRRLELVQNPAFLDKKDDCLVWLGHAWFFLRIGGIEILLDPVLTKLPLVKQLIPAPYAPSYFKNVDLILVSHDHRDHMDKSSLTALGILNPEATVVTGLGNTGILNAWMKNKKVEMGWYQQFEFEKTGLKITYLPTRHWSRRLFNDTNKRLWGAFMIEFGNKKIYFGSDSGYGSHFAELPSLFGKIDLAMLGIGAFRPEWFMHQAHMSPMDAAKAFADMQAITMFPMHHGTLDLSDEPPGEPMEIIEDLKSRGEIQGSLLTPPIGLSVEI